MHGGLCDCCKCDRRENRRLRLIDETVDALPDAISAALDDFLSDVVSTAVATAGDDEDDLDGEDFTDVALEALIRVAAKRFRVAAAADGYTPAMIDADLATLTQAEAGR